ncbi:MAG: hypothetical protein WC820_05700 [Spirochaetales bacterium]|jgi:hypothetical protein
MIELRASKLAAKAAMRAFALGFCLFAASAASAHTSGTPASVEIEAAKDGTITRFQGWEVRYGVAGKPVVVNDMTSLVGKAETFAVEVFKSKDAATGENRVFGTGEAHGFFAVPLEAAVSIVVDYPNLKAISPRVREVKVVDSSAARWYVYEDIGITFMGISIGYKLEAETLRDELPDGAVGIRCRLAKSVDGKLYASDASWYFRKVEIGGASYTYIRTWSTSGLRNPAAGVAGIMKLFTAGELRDQVNAVVKLAGR